MTATKPLRAQFLLRLTGKYLGLSGNRPAVIARPILQCFQGRSARWLPREGSNSHVPDRFSTFEISGEFRLKSLIFDSGDFSAFSQSKSEPRDDPCLWSVGHIWRLEGTRGSQLSLQKRTPRHETAKSASGPKADVMIERAGRQWVQGRIGAFLVPRETRHLLARQVAKISISPHPAITA
jgi:hypothetical protein